MATATTSTTTAAMRAYGVCPDCRQAPASLIHDFTTGDLFCAHCRSSVSQRLVQAADSSSSEPASPTPRSRQRSVPRMPCDLAQYCVPLDIPPATEALAQTLYRRAEAAQLLRGRKPSVLAACLFLACRQHGLPRTLKEICHHTRVPRRDIGRTFRVLKDRLVGLSPLAVVAEDLVSRFAHALSLGAAAVQCALRVHEAVRERDLLAGRSPVSVAAACVFLAAYLCAQPRLSAVVARAAGVSEVTIRAAYRLLYADRVHLLLPYVLAPDPLADIANLPPP
ncbi:transcription initiation factor IIB [Coemansia sp. RSA 2603]|nr:transcription initiation factor IIB [Coemansia sp. RSA 2603]